MGISQRAASVAGLQASAGNRAMQRILCAEADGDGGGTSPSQRATREGRDQMGSYTFNEDSCVLTYAQDWYFTFETEHSAEERAEYMQAARDQVADAWSGTFPLIPDEASCPCAEGVEVVVDITAREGSRRWPRGVAVQVSQEQRRARVNPPRQRMYLGPGDDRPVRFRTDDGGVRSHPVIAHEFGHTIAQADEYQGLWARPWQTEGWCDPESIMHEGAAARLRHYQYFADLLNVELGGACTYRPLGVRLPEYERPVERLSGFPEPLTRLQHERRVSNYSILGWLDPTVGVVSMLDPARGTVEAGPIAGARLNRILHPLFVDIHTGLLLEPTNVGGEGGLKAPLSLSLGARRSSLRIGAKLHRGRRPHALGEVKARDRRRCRGDRAERAAERGLQGSTGPARREPVDSPRRGEPRPRSAGVAEMMVRDR